MFEIIALALIVLAAGHVLWAGSGHVTRREAMKDPAYRLKVKRYEALARLQAEIEQKRQQKG